MIPIMEALSHVVIFMAMGFAALITGALPLMGV
jgi:hypothetical protein